MSLVICANSLILIKTLVEQSKNFSLVKTWQLYLRFIFLTLQDVSIMFSLLRQLTAHVDSCARKNYFYVFLKIYISRIITMSFLL